jgi:cbb3-type cytochrome oxidase subunit 3
MLSQMAKSFFADSPLLAYPLIAMALFMTVFVVITWRTMRRDPHDYDALAQLPLGDDAPVQTEATES